MKQDVLENQILPLLKQAQEIAEREGCNLIALAETEYDDAIQMTGCCNIDEDRNGVSALMALMAMLTDAPDELVSMLHARLATLRQDKAPA